MPIHVVAGAIADARGRILIARRPGQVHQGGRWEFPGGKLEPGETPVAALARELNEELGIRVLSSRPLIRVRHDYGDRRILLDVRRVVSHEGEPQGHEGQPLAWVHPQAMDPAAFPAADRPVISALRLPERYLITGADPQVPGRFLNRLDRALASGVRLVQLRAHDLRDDHYIHLALGAFQLCTEYGARLLLNRDPALVRELPCHGLHLTARRLTALAHRPWDDRYLVGASCHDARELSQAARLGLDYALLSPVRATHSHPDARPLGWLRFAALAEAAGLPVYALGGLGPDDLERAFAHGAQGIAAIRGFWPD
ncbi:MAG: Nudix family hydrolase [Candidatus Thiosymbion ectosymbiont of Robbea hypermnestra]|nr:Nudix family hydrolase [Candidatus Thiosymbion ectosymbiont of Robbea hypermnestra]